MSNNPENVIRATEQEIAVAMHSAKINLFGSISCLKEIIPNKNMKVESAEILQGRKLYKAYGYDGMATMGSYKTSVNNARLRAGLEADFEPQDLPWGEKFVLNGVESKIVIVHKGKYYLQVRTTKNSKGKTRFFFSDGTDVAYKTIEPILTSKDKFKDTKTATADHQGLPIDEIVPVRTLTIANITRFAYGGNVYEVVPQAMGVQSRPVDRDEEQDATQTP